MSNNIEELTLPVLASVLSEEIIRAVSVETLISTTVDTIQLELSSAIVSVNLKLLEEIDTANSVEISISNTVAGVGAIANAANASSISNTSSIAANTAAIADNVNAITQLSNSITSEVARASSVESSISIVVSANAFNAAQLSNTVSSNAATVAQLSNTVSSNAATVAQLSNTVSSNAATVTQLSNTVSSNAFTVTQLSNTLASNNSNSVNSSQLSSAISNASNNLTNKIDNALSKIAFEGTRAQGVEASLTSDLASESSRAQAAEASLTSDLASEASRAQAAEASLTSDLASEASRAQGAESSLETRVSVEETRAVAKEASIVSYVDNAITQLTGGAPDLLNTLGELANALNQDDQLAATVLNRVTNVDVSLNLEVSRAQAAEASLTSGLASESSRAQGAESSLETRVSVEEIRAVAKEASIVSYVENAVDSAINTLLGGAPDILNTLNEFAVALNGDASFATTILNRVANVDASLNLEVSRALTAEAVLTSGLADEVSRAQSAEATLTSDLSSEVSRAVAKESSIVSYVDTAITQLTGSAPELLNTLNELAVALNGDASFATTVLTRVTNLDVSLNLEVSRAEAAEGVLTSDLAGEVTRAQGAEATLTSDLAAEVSRAQGAESTLTSDLATEVSRAQGAEAELKSNAISETRVPYSLAVLGGAHSPLVTPVAILNNPMTCYDGWYYKKLTNVSPINKINWYVAPEISMKVADLNAVGMAFKILNTTYVSSNPFITVYTKPTGTGDAASWYKSKRTYIINYRLDASQSYVASFDFVNNNTERLKVYGHQQVQLLFNSDITSSQGNFASTEEIGSVALGTDSGAYVNGVEFILSEVLVKSAQRTHKFKFANADVMISAVDVSLNVEVSRAQGAEATLTSGLAAEVSRALTAESVLTSGLASEVSRAQGAEAVLTSGLAGEVSRAQGAEATLRNDLAGEVIRAQGAESSLETRVSSEETRALAKEVSIVSYVDNAITQLTGGAPDLLNTLGELAQALNQDAYLATTVLTRVTNVDVSLNLEVVRATSVEATLTSGLAGEVSRAQGAEAELKSNAISETRVPYSLAVLGGAQSPLPTPVAILSNPLTTYDGWYYKKLTNVSPINKINWYVGPEISMKVSDLNAVGMAFKILNTTYVSSNPFITVYTKPTGTGDAASWYKSKRTYIINYTLTASQSYVASFDFVNNNTERLKVYGHQQVQLLFNSDITSSQGNFASTEEIGSVALGTDSGAYVNGVEFILSEVLVKSAQRTHKFKFANADVMISAVDASLNVEVSRAKSAEATLESGLAGEASRAQGAEATLTTNLSSEVSRAKSAEGVLTSGLAAEVTRAQGAEGVLTSGLAGEVSRAQGAEGVLTSGLASEVSRAQGAEGVLTSGLAAEVTRAQGAEGVLTSDLASEVSRAQGAELTLRNDLASEETRAIAKEASIVSYVDTAITQLTGGAPDLLNTLNELADALNSDASFATTVLTRVTNLDVSLNLEVARAEAAESTLTSDLATEVSRAQGAESSLETRISDEVSRAQAAEAELKSNAISETRVPYSVAVLGGAQSPLVTPVAILNNPMTCYDGWYYKKLTNVSPINKINWYVAPEISMKVSDLNAVGMAFKILNTTYVSSNPFITVYTKPTGTGDAASWYKSKRTYIINYTLTASQSYIASFDFVNNNTERLKVYGHQQIQLLFNSDITSSEGNFASTEEISSIALGTDSGAYVNGVEFILSEVLVKSAQRTHKFKFANADVMINSVDASLNLEVSRAKGAETSLQTRITDEVSRAQGAEAVLTSGLAGEVTRAQGAETSLQTRITDEVSRAQGAELTLRNDLSSEASRAKGIELSLQTRLYDEEQRAQGAESILQTRVSVEETRAIAKEASIVSYIDSAITQLTGGAPELLNTLGELAQALNQDQYFATTVLTRVTNVDVSLNIEVARAQGAEAVLTSGLSSEVVRAEGAELTLRNNLSTEVSRAQSAEAELKSDAISEARVTYSIPVIGGAHPPLPIPVSILNANSYDGWYYKKLTNVSPINKINWYVGPEISMKVSDLNAVGMAFKILNTTYISSNPIITVYTKPTGTGDAASWYKSKRTYIVNYRLTASQNYIASFDFTNNNTQRLNVYGHEQIQLVPATYVTPQPEGNFLSTEEIAFFSLGTDSGAPLNGVEIILSEVLVKTASRTQKFKFANADIMINSVDASLNVEISRAKGAESSLETRVSNEVVRAMLSEGSLQTRISDEVVRAMLSEGSLQTRISTEASRAMLSETSLQTRITDEVSRAQGAEAVLTSDLAAEVTRAQGAEAVLTSGLAAEVTRAQGAEAVLTSDLASEESRAIAKEASIVSYIDTAITQLTGGAPDLLNTLGELAVALSSDASFATTVLTRVTNVDVSLNLEVARAMLSEGSLQTRISDEVVRATLSEGTLQTRISNEVVRAQGAEAVLTSGLAGEASRAQGAEAVLTSGLATEITRAQGAESSLETRVSAEEVRAQIVEQDNLSMSLISNVDLVGFSDNWKAINVKNDNNYLNCISISSNGEYQTIGMGTGVYVSNNYGNTWTYNELGKNIRIVSVSSTGKYQSGIVYGSGILLSQDYGVTWTEQIINYNRSWTSISVSSTGKYQTACVINGSIFTSNDYGATWTEESGAPQIQWSSVSLSLSGQYQIACAQNSSNTGSAGGYLYVSSNYGKNWTAKMTDANRVWTSVTISSTGQYLIACLQANYIYVSNDYGNTWSVKIDDKTRWWSSVSISSTGKYQTAVSKNYDELTNLTSEQIYVSTDYGNNWTAKGIARYWSSVSLSSNGQYLVALSEPNRFDNTNNNANNQNFVFISYCGPHTSELSTEISRAMSVEASLETRISSASTSSSSSAALTYYTATISNGPTTFASFTGLTPGTYMLFVNVNVIPFQYSDMYTMYTMYSSSNQTLKSESFGARPPYMPTILSCVNAISITGSTYSINISLSLEYNISSEGTNATLIKLA